MKVTDSINFVLGGVIAAMSYVFGDRRWSLDRITMPLCMGALRGN